MKICKYCKEQIGEEATKCPKCQSYQVWYKSPIILSTVPMLLVFVYLFFSMSSLFTRIDYGDYKRELIIKQLSQDTVSIKGSQKINVLVEIENRSDQRWEKAVYEVKYKSKSGEILNIEKYSDYNFVIRPKEKIMSSVRIPLYEEYSEAILDVKILDLRHGRY